MRISKNLVDNLGVGQELRDSELKGFGVRRQEGVPRYFVQARIGGKLKRLTIGIHGSPWTPETARKEAARLLLAIRAGNNPASERDSRRVVDATFTSVANDYLSLHGAKLKPRTREEYARLIRRQLVPAFGKKSLAEITTVEVERAHTRWKETPRAANHALAVLSSIFGWAEDHRLIQVGSNPCLKIDRYPEQERERYLTEEELGRLGAALQDAETEGTNPFVIALIRLLLLTGARLSEMLTLRWDFLDRQRELLRLPDSKTGAKVIVLNKPAMAVIDTLPRLAGNPWMLPGHIQGSHLVNAQKPWRAIRDKAGLADVRLHDLRHSFASFGVDAGGSLVVIGKLLGHAQAQTTARYAHVAPSPARNVADQVGNRIMEAWTRKPVPTEAAPALKQPSGSE